MAGARQHFQQSFSKIAADLEKPLSRLLSGVKRKQSAQWLRKVSFLMSLLPMIIVSNYFLDLRFIKQRPLRVIEALIVGMISSVVAFNLIYFKPDCAPFGNNNATDVLQVRQTSQ